MVGLDGSNKGDFFLAGGETPKNGMDGDGLCVRNAESGYCDRVVNGKAFIHKENEWQEVRPMPTPRKGKKPCIEVVPMSPFERVGPFGHVIFESWANNIP